MNRLLNAGDDRVRLGVDVGGTFIDCILTDDSDGSMAFVKVPSEADTGKSVIGGIETLLSSSSKLADKVGHLGHGTTVATNSIISGTGVSVGVITTRGFRDVLLLGRARFPEPTNLNGRLPSQLAPRDLIVEVDERIDVRGTVIRGLDSDDVERKIASLVARGVKAIAVCFLHAHRYPIHELRVKALVEERYPDIFVSCSSEIHAKPREYERFLATVMNSSVGSRVAKYLDKVAVGASRLGIKPNLLVTRSNGGIMSADSAGSLPVHTMLSGPAAGVIAARYFAKAAGFENIVTWDMGGTSLDVSVLDGRVRHTDNARIGDFPLFVPTVDVVSVGAGGGSIARLDGAGLLHVGPASAGADPGPAAYDRGGTEPTLTDAYVTLGIIDPTKFAGSALRLRADLARSAIEKLGRTLGLDAERTAEAIITVATEQMYAEFMPVLARQGVDLRNAPLYPFGGAGPTHAFLFAQAVGFHKIVVPRHPGLLCAWGTILADVRYETSRAIGRELSHLRSGDIDETFAELDEEAMTWLKRQNIATRSTSIIRLANVRYHGQSFDIEIVLPGGGNTIQEIERRFLAAYEERYGYAESGRPLDLVSISSHVVGVTEKPHEAPSPVPTSRYSRSERSIYIDGSWRQVPVFDRAEIEVGPRFAGPLVVDQLDTTVYVPSGFELYADAAGNLIGEAQ